jgi:hypothetical protein
MGGTPMPRRRLSMRPIHLLSMCVLLPFAALAATEEKPAELTVEAAGLRVIAPFKTADAALNAFSSQTPGTCVSLLISSPTDHFVHFDSHDSVITKFTDDRGKDLLAKTSGPTPPDGEPLVQQGFSLFPQISKDGKACAVEITAGLLPDKGAAAIKLSGVIAMLSSSAKREFIQKDVALKPDSKIVADDLKLSIARVEVPDRTDERAGHEALAVTLRAHQELDRIAEMKFYNADGKEIFSRSAGVTKMGVLGTLTVDWTFNLAERADTVIVKIYLWSDFQTKKQNFDLAISTGL